MDTTSAQSDGTEPKDESPAISFVDHLTDPGKFSYLALCSTALSLLFGSAEDKVYRHKTIYSLVKHVHLESNCYPTMVAISDGMSDSDSNVFVKMLRDEKIVQDTPEAVAYDLVSWALLSDHGDGSRNNPSGRYDSRTRILLRHVTWQLRIVLEDLEKAERNMVEMLQSRTEQEKMEHDEERGRNQRKSKIKRYTLIGLAAIGGGALIGLTGGLAAPLVASGAGAIFGASAAATLGSVAGLAVITSLFGAAGAGLTGYKMKRRVGGIDQFIFRPLTPGKELSITIAISGWLSSSQGQGDFAIPWQSLRQSQEQYYLAWESEHLLRLGGALEYILDSLVSVAASEALKYTVLSGLVAAVAWPASLIGAASIIDNPWSVCLQRATQAGRELADVLLSRLHGHRPVTLIGFSLGAKVIFHCLEEMSRRKNSTGIVEDVILLGAPVTGNIEKWMEFSKVVAGHITNGYCRSDWLLKFLYRTSSRQAAVAGLQPVEWHDRRMINIDLTSLVSGHLDYRTNMTAILPAVGIRSSEEVLNTAQATVLGAAKKSPSLDELKVSVEESALSSAISEPTDVSTSAPSHVPELPDTLEKSPNLPDPSDNSSRKSETSCFSDSSSIANTGPNVNDTFLVNTNCSNNVFGNSGVSDLSFPQESYVDGYNDAAETCIKDSGISLITSNISPSVCKTDSLDNLSTDVSNFSGSDFRS